MWVADTLLLQGKVYLIMCVCVCLLLIETSLCAFEPWRISIHAEIYEFVLKVPIDRNSITEGAEKLFDKADRRIFMVDLHECKYVHSHICNICVWAGDSLRET